MSYNQTQQQQQQQEDPDDKFYKPVDNGKPLFEVTDVNFVALWGWNSTTDNCAICHESLLSPCIGCASLVHGQTKCGVTWSQCLHGYHTHCIKKWISTRDTCPLCNSPWVEQEIRGD